MSENTAKTPAEQAAAAQVETPEPVEEQAVQAESAADTADQPAAPAELEEAPQEVAPRPVIVEVPGWALVKTGAGTGWVNTTFLTEAEA